MEVAVRGVVVVVNAGHFTIHEQPGDVLVIDRPRLRAVAPLSPWRP